LWDSGGGTPVVGLMDGHLVNGFTK